MTVNEPESYTLQAIPQPTTYARVQSTALSDETQRERLHRVLHAMRQQGLDALIIYADKEHGGNFEYLSGFIPRFEEALLIVAKNGAATYVMGNENLKLVPHARLPGTVLHAPCFSLPDQPMPADFDLTALLAQSGIPLCQRVGIAGWKHLKLSGPSDLAMFDIPHFIYQSIRNALPSAAALVNATGIFISPNGGVRTLNNANELAHYEYGANLASTAMLNALNAIEIGKTEKEIAALLAAEGQPHTVVTIAATGDRFEQARLYPGDKKIAPGDKLSLTTGFKGGLSSRAAYAVKHREMLPAKTNDYLERVAIPYYHAVVCWLTALRVGITGGEIYALIEEDLPKERFHWHLNPGHLVADEEWLCSPISQNSPIALASGMLLQIDIIPSVAGYAGASIEDTVALADADLRAELASAYPALWQRILTRRTYLEAVLHIPLHADVLPMSNTVGYLRPFLLDKQKALVCGG